jgi:hypothetical protein
MPKELPEKIIELMPKTKNRVYAKVKWNGGKNLYEAILAYQKEREVFCKKNNMKVAQVDEFLKQPDVLVKPLSLKDSLTPVGSRNSRDAAVRIGVAENAGLVATSPRVSRIKTAVAVTKRVTKKSK